MLFLKLVGLASGLFLLLQCGGGTRQAPTKKIFSSLIRAAGSHSSFCTASATCNGNAIAACLAVARGEPLSSPTTPSPPVPPTQGRDSAGLRSSATAATCEQTEKFVRCTEPSGSSYACCDHKGNAFTTENESDALVSCGHR